MTPDPTLDNYVIDMPEKCYVPEGIDPQPLIDTGEWEEEDVPVILDGVQNRVFRRIVE